MWLYLSTKAIDKYVKDYYKNKESLYIQYWDVNNLYDWEMLQKLPVNNFEWVKDTCDLMKISEKNYTKVMKGIFSKLMLNILTN